MRSLALVCLLALVAPAQAEDLPGWKLAWSDDFDQLDQNLWTLVDTNVPTNNSLQDYLPEQVTVQNGSLVITAEAEPSRGLQYRSGQVISKSEQRLGRWEVRAKLPTGQGMWPAIWLLPEVNTYLWPSGGEIDIMENRGDSPHLTSSAFHYGSRTPYPHNFVYGEQQTAKSGTMDNYHDSFHTYAVDWTDNLLRFYVDGVHHYSVHDDDVGGFLSNNTAPMQLVINNAIGGDFLANPVGSNGFPVDMLIDYVRVYEYDPDSFEATFTNGDFEQEGGSLAGWSVFGNDLMDNPNVSVSSDAVAAGSDSLKLFGTFSPQASYSGVTQGITVTGGAEVNASLSSFIRSVDSISGTDNFASLKIEFYSEFGAKYGSAGMVGEVSQIIVDGSSAEDVWNASQISATAPPGAVEARVAIVFAQPTQAGGALHVDNVSFTAVLPTSAAGDFNADGQVDAADYSLWRNSLGDTGALLPADGNGDGEVTREDYEIWRQHFGATSQATPNPSAVPEPELAVVTLGALLVLGAQREATPRKTGSRTKDD